MTSTRRGTSLIRRGQEETGDMNWRYLHQLGEGGITPHCLGEGDHPWVANLVAFEAEIEMARVGEGECERWGNGRV